MACAPLVGNNSPKHCGSECRAICLRMRNQFYSEKQNRLDTLLSKRRLTKLQLQYARSYTKPILAFFCETRQYKKNRRLPQKHLLSLSPSVKNSPCTRTTSLCLCESCIDMYSCGKYLGRAMGTVQTYLKWNIFSAYTETKDAGADGASGHISSRPRKMFRFP